jgi:superfamily II DNA or RNA helicase
MKLRPYQQQLIDSIQYHLKDNDRCCAALATGGGKTFCFSYLIKDLVGKTLVLVHRIELVNQTSDSLTNIGVEHDKIIANHKEKESDIYVCMVQTLYNRIKKGKININDYDNIIVDECHRGDFFKIIQEFKGKVVGFTATPINHIKSTFFLCENCDSIYHEHQKCCKRDVKKYSRTSSLSDHYGKLIEGVSISELINQGHLVQDINYEVPAEKIKFLKVDNSGEFSEETQSIVFGSEKAMQNFTDIFAKLALGKKTIIFNSNTLINKKLFNIFLKLGYPVKIYDSNNTDGESREDVVEWFKTTPKAILMNVQVFTTGFDAKDVECIVLNKATTSLSLFIQMVGRGSRTTTDVYKPSFDVIDLGGNIERLGKWSDERNWEGLYYYSEEKKSGDGVPSIRQCHECEAIIAANCIYCSECNAEKKYVGGGFGIPKINGKIPLPNVENIIKHCEDNDLDILECRKYIYDYFARMFYETSKEVFNEAKESGELYDRLKQVATPMYFSIQGSQLKGNKSRRLENFINEIIKKINKTYD